MNIAFISDGLGLGGKERQLTEIVKYLSKREHKIIVYYFNEKEGFLPLIKQYADKVIRIPKLKKKSIKPFFFLYKSFRENKFNVIHTFDSMSTFYSIFSAKLLKIPITDGSIRDAGIEKGSYYWFKRLNLFLADNVIANSKAGLKYYKVKNGNVVYNAIDENRFNKSLQNTGNIVMVASFSNYKDHLTYLLASKLLIEKNMINNSFLVGGGVNLGKYKRMVQNWGMEDKMIFYAKTNNVEQILQQCDIGILCSTKKYREGVSNSILEYMASGLLAIGSNIGGTPEIINDKMNGLLFEPENFNSLVRCVVFALSNPDKKNKMIFNGIETVNTKFSFQQNIDKLMKIYTVLIQKKMAKKC